MNNVGLYDPKQELTAVSVLYHDNEQNQIEQFMENVNTDAFRNFESTTDSRVALKLISTGLYDIFICDFRLPGNIDGVEVIKKAMKIKPDLKGILYTGFALQHHQIQACDKAGINRAKKLEPDTLRPLISLAANEIDNLVESFETKTIDRSELEPLDLNEVFEDRIEREEDGTMEQLKTLKQNFHILGADLINDYKSLSHPEQLNVYFGLTDATTAKELIDDLEQLNPRGVLMIKNWLEGRQVIEHSRTKEQLESIR